MPKPKAIETEDKDLPLRDDIRLLDPGVEPVLYLQTEAARSVAVSNVSGALSREVVDAKTREHPAG